MIRTKNAFHEEYWNLQVRSEKDRCSKIHSKHATCRQCQSSQQGRQNRLCGKTCSFCSVVFHSRAISPSPKRDGAIQLSVPTTENFTFSVDIKVIARSNNLTLSFSPFSSQSYFSRLQPSQPYPCSCKRASRGRVSARVGLACWEV